MCYTAVMTARALPYILLLSLVSCLGCRADDEVRRGVEGEFCNGRDDDCRAGLLCEAGVCVDLGPASLYSCDEICTRLAQCDAAEPGCASDCRVTTEDWSGVATDAFGKCLVDELSCAAARERFAPQTCYSRIPVAAERRERCDAFVQDARACGADLETLERVLEGCVALARVSVATRWEATARCASAPETGVCSQTATCFNQELDLDPAISLGN